MASECSELSKENARIGDRYYRAVTAWVKSRGRSPELREKASGLARLYDKTLQFLLDCLRRLRRSPAVKRQIDAAEEYQVLLEKDKELLSSRQDPQTPTTQVDNGS